MPSFSSIVLSCALFCLLCLLLLYVLFLYQREYYHEEDIARIFVLQDVSGEKDILAGRDLPIPTERYS